MKIKTSELTGAALAYAVAQITPDLMQVGLCFYIRDVESGERVLFNPAENWSQAGPIIEREWINVVKSHDGACWQAASERWMLEDAPHTGPTPLVAAMRCYVASKLGDEVEVPDELA